MPKLHSPYRLHHMISQKVFFSNVMYIILHHLFMISLFCSSSEQILSVSYVRSTLLDLLNGKIDLSLGSPP